MGYLEQGARAAVPHDAARPAGVRPDPHLGVRLLRLDRVLRVSEAFQLGHHAVGTLLTPCILLQRRRQAADEEVVGHRGLTFVYSLRLSAVSWPQHRRKRVSLCAGEVLRSSYCCIL